MPTIEYNGKSFEVDEKGFLVRFEDWDEGWVECCKTATGKHQIIACLNADGSLTDEHYEIINFLQEYYRKNGFAPMARQISHSTNTRLQRIYELFPAGPGSGAGKTAGLPMSASS